MTQIDASLFVGSETPLETFDRPSSITPDERVIGLRVGGTLTLHLSNQSDEDVARTITRLMDQLTPLYVAAIARSAQTKVPA